MLSSINISESYKHHQISLEQNVASWYQNHISASSNVFSFQINYFSVESTTGWMIGWISKWCALARTFLLSCVANELSQQLFTSFWGWEIALTECLNFSVTPVGLNLTHGTNNQMYQYFQLIHPRNIIIIWNMTQRTLSVFAVSLHRDV